MPLHVWRSDEVTPLSPHPDDPRAASSIGGTEFLTSFTIAIPHGTSPDAVTDAEAAESARMKALGQGPLERLWMLSSPSGWLGLWKASSPAELQAILTSLPMDSWMTVQTTPLSRHPSDPGTDGSGP